LNGRVFRGLAAANFKSAGQREIAIDVEFGEDALEAAQNISQAGQIARGRFRKGHPAGAPARSRADAIRLKYDDGFFWRETAQPCGRGQTCETSADDSEVNRLRKSALPHLEIDRPGRFAPFEGFIL
jgi:hypothetical protein